MKSTRTGLLVAVFVVLTLAAWPGAALAAAPTVTGLDPAFGPTTPDTVVTITGTGFVDVTAVTFGGNAPEFYLVDSPTQIRATIWGHAAGPVDVQVVTAEGPSDTSGTADDYTYLDPPTVTGLGPTAGPATGGTVVTITGTGFLGMGGPLVDPDAVTFGGADVLTYHVDSDTQITATAPAHAAGTVQVQVTTPGGASADTDADDFTYSVAYTSYRGSDRYFTALLLSQAAFPTALPDGSGVVVAPGTTFPEALCGAPLAAAYGGPVLLTPTTGLHNDVKAELQRLQPDYVFVIGLSATIRNNVQTALPGATITPIGGATIYHMSHNVALALGARVNSTGGDISDAVGLVTIGTKFVDALGLGPLACAQKWPIILTDGTASGPLHAEAVATFTDLGMTQMIKVGTYAGPPSGVTSLANLSGVAPAGQSHLARYYTNANVANWALANAGLSFTHTAITTGDKFPDALASGPFLATDNGILLVSPLAGPVPDVIKGVVTVHREEVRELTFIACIEPVIGTVKGLLPSETVNLIFIHHSCGQNWLNDGLCAGLNDSGYHVADTTYGWTGTGTIDYGSSTDTLDWPTWFTDTVMEMVYDEMDAMTAPNTLAPAPGENTIIMFKSCYPCSDVGSSITDEKAVYNSLLPYCQAHPDKMFVLVTPPPMISISYPLKTRELCNWLVDRDAGWLKDLTTNNVFVFDFYNVLTAPGAHHYVSGGVETHVVVPGYNTLYYPSGGDNHPNDAGNLKAAQEFVPLLNLWYQEFLAAQ